MPNYTNTKELKAASPTGRRSRIERLPLDAIQAEAATRIRASMDPNIVADYAKAMKDPAAELPPVVVFHDGPRHILADGFHRVAAARANGWTEIRAEIRHGTRADALRYALGANTGHGLPRTYRDKRRSVALALAQWPELSIREIARICAVSDPFVAKWCRHGEALEPDSAGGHERRPRFAGHGPSRRHHGPGFERPQFEGGEAEEKRLKHLADTWPATCGQCEKEFRHDKREPEPASCPSCAAETRECKLCGKPFDASPGKEFCSPRCAKWHAEHSARAE